MKKKILSFVSVLVFATALFAQVMGSSGVRNTLSTGFGRPYGRINDDNRSNVRFHGFIDTLQVRFDLAKSKFTVEGMLNWGAYTDGNGYFGFSNTERNPFWYNNHFWYNDGKDAFGQESWWTNGNTESYYVNFLFHPIEGLDLGMGTRLNWKIGPAPSSTDNYWGPKAHVIQGGLKDSDPGKSDVAGFAYYANKYTSNYHNGIRDGGQYANAAIAARYRYQKLFEVGFAIPSGSNSNYPKFNLAFKLTPVSDLAAYIAYDGVLQSDYSNLYTGLSFYLNNIDIDFYVAGNFRLKGKENGNVVNNDKVGLGASANISFPKSTLSLKPELGLTFYMNNKYTPAFYFGSRFDVFLQKTFNLGGWLSFAWGSSNKNWKDSKLTEDYCGGFIFDIRPDFTWDLNTRNDVSIYFDYQNRTTYKNDKYDVWSGGIYWTYKN